MANTNCLAGMKCPKCGSEGPFDISVQACARVHDDGFEEVLDVEWRDESPCACRECKFEGKVEDFSMSEPTIPTLAGMRCPKCGSLGPIDISEIYASAVVRPDGTPEGIIELSNFRCEPGTLCFCKKCEHRGRSEEFLNGKQEHSN